MKTVIFDIETAPNLKAVQNFTKPFNRDEVKLGNLKDEEKIAAKLDNAETTYWAKANDQAQLNPHTSTICAIGYQVEGDAPILLFGEEVDILTEFWKAFNNLNHFHWLFYSGCNDRSAFDPRHIIVRSWANKVNVPHRLVSERGYLSPAFIDLAQMYLFGDKFPAYCSVELAIKQLGIVGTKNCAGTVHSKDQIESDLGITGKNFWQHLETSPAKCHAYLTNDLACERGIAERIYS